MFSRSNISSIQITLKPWILPSTALLTLRHLESLFQVLNLINVGTRRWSPRPLPYSLQINAAGSLEIPYLLPPPSAVTDGLTKALHISIHGGEPHLHLNGAETTSPGPAIATYSRLSHAAMFRISMQCTKCIWKRRIHYFRVFGTALHVPCGYALTTKARW